MKKKNCWYSTNYEGLRKLLIKYNVHGRGNLTTKSAMCEALVKLQSFGSNNYSYYDNTINVKSQVNPKQLVKSQVIPKQPIDHQVMYKQPIKPKIKPQSIKYVSPKQSIKYISESPVRYSSVQQIKSPIKINYNLSNPDDNVPYISPINEYITTPQMVIGNNNLVSFSQLPSETVGEVSRYLNPSEMSNLRQVNKELSENQYIQKDLLSEYNKQIAMNYYQEQRNKYESMGYDLSNFSMEDVLESAFLENKSLEFILELIKLGNYASTDINELIIKTISYNRMDIFNYLMNDNLFDQFITNDINNLLYEAYVLNRSEILNLLINKYSSLINKDYLEALLIPNNQKNVENNFISLI